MALPFAGSLVIPPPDHVLRAFGAPSVPPDLLEGGRGRSWRFGNVVIKPVGDPAEASWLANVFEGLQVQGVRLARPIRSSDGRWVVAGWHAHRFVSGRPSPAKFEEILQASEALHAALKDVPEPRFLRDRTDLYSWADRLAWGEIDDTDGRTGSGYGARQLAGLAVGRRRVDALSQVIHGDLLGNVLFAGNAPPAIVGITPYWRPAAWASAVIAVDALAWGDAPIEILTEWSRKPSWPQLVRRALIFRLAISLAHPLTPPNDLVTMLSTAERIEPFLD
jgi:uncharacterized protein (TIGR02569 family)